jgi:pre-mRNA-processing factor 17
MRLYTAPTTTEVPVNIPYSDMMLPTVGPENPFTQKKMATQNVLTGHIESEAMNETDFRTQLRTFESYGYARDPSISSTGVNGSVGSGILGTGYIGDVNKAIEMGGATIYDTVPKNMRPNQNLKERRKPKGDSSVLEGDNAYLGPWAGYENEKIGQAARPTDEELEFVSAMHTKTRQPKTAGEIPFGEEKTVFHGKAERDYLGRTYMAVPQDLDVNLLGEPGTQQSFIPKRCIHTWSGHTRGVSAIRFLPKSAHLLLSAGMDNKIKVGDTALHINIKYSFTNQ